MKKIFLILVAAASTVFGEGSESLKIGTQTHNIQSPTTINWTGSTLNFSGASVSGLPSGSGTVTSVAVSGANGIGVSGSPITTSGTISLTLPITIAGTSGKTLTVSNNLTLAGTDGSTLNIGTGGTLGSAAFDNQSALTKTDDTNVTLTLGGTPSTALLHAASITAGWTGTLAISRGGTGAATVAHHTIFGNNAAGVAAPAFQSDPAFDKISNLTTNGFVKTGSSDGTLSIDTNTYITGNQTITLSGAISGSGTTAITTSLSSFSSANLASALTNETGSGLAVFGTSPNITTPTGIVSSDVGLGNVTNDAQTKAVIVPNTAPAAGQILVGNAGGTAYAKQTLSGSGATISLASTGVATISAIANASLSNSAITIAGTSTSLGGSITLDTITGVSSNGLLKRTGSNALTNVAAPTGVVVGDSDTQTLTNKRINPRINGISTGSAPTPNADTDDVFRITALAGSATFGAPTGSPVEGQKLLIRIKDNGTAQSLAWNAIYRASSDLSLPTTTVISKTMYLLFVYNNTDSKWDLLALLGNF